MYVNLFYAIFIIYFLLMNRLIISLGEQNFSAVEDLNNAEITNYVIFFPACTFLMQKDSYQGNIKTKHFKLPLSRKCEGKMLSISLKIND